MQLKIQEGLGEGARGNERRKYIKLRCIPNKEITKINKYRNGKRRNI
jgi:hypothetical protein